MELTNRRLGEIRDAIERLLLERIGSNAVDGTKDILMAAEIANAINSQASNTALLAKMEKCLYFDDGRPYLAEMHSLLALTKAWRLAVQSLEAP